MVGCVLNKGSVSSLRIEGLVGRYVFQLGAAGACTGSTDFLKERMRRLRLKTFLKPVVMRSIEKMLSRAVGALEMVCSKAVGAEANC